MAYDPRPHKRCEPNFDPNSPIDGSSSVLVPPPSDPRIIAQRAEARRIWDEKAAKYQIQWELHWLRDNFLPNVVRDVGWAYTMPPSNRDEVISAMTLYKVGADIQARILAAVDKGAAH